MISKTFIGFAFIGGLAFIVDAAILVVALKLGAGLYGGRFLSYICAATFTWYFNRVFTFKNNDPKILLQWARFLSANSIGGAVNYTVYAICVSFLELVSKYPVIGVAVGSISGLMINFFLSKHMVFKK